MSKSQFKIMHSADFHLNSPFNFLSAGRKKEAQIALIKSFYQALRLAQEAQVDFFTIAGDLFDSVHINQFLVDKVKEAIQSVPQLKIIMVPGNHDYWHIDSYWEVFNGLDNVYVLDPDNLCYTFEEFEVSFWGRPFTAQSSIYSLWHDDTELFFSKKRNKINILLQHGDIQNRDSNYGPIQFEWVDKMGFDLVLLGHVHNPQEPLYSQRQIPCLYSGCAQGRAFDELGNKGVQLIDLTFDEANQGLKFKISFLPINYLSFNQYEINLDKLDQEDKVQFYEELVAACLNYKQPKNNLNQYPLQAVRFVLSGQVLSEVNKDLVINRLDNHFFHLEILDRTKIIIENQNLLSEHSLRGDITRYAKQLAVQPDLLKSVLEELNIQNVTMQRAMAMIELAYYYTMQAEEQDIDIYED